MRQTTAIALLLLISGCPKTVPSEPGTAAVAAALPPAELQLQQEVTALGKEATALVKERDEALWAHWTLGAVLELDKPALKHAVLFEDATLAKVRLARAKQLGNAVGLRRLDAWIVGERAARAAEAANGALAELEAASTFQLEDKELHWRELGKLLANEKSAVKRKALWAASRAAVPRIAEARRKRDEVIAQTPEAIATISDETAAIARALLDEPRPEWKQVLEQLASSELGLPLDKVTRADLPRLLNRRRWPMWLFRVSSRRPKRQRCFRRWGSTGSPASLSI